MKVFFAASCLDQSRAVLTYLSADPVAMTHSLKGLKLTQLTSAVCACTESTTPTTQPYNVNALDHNVSDSPLMGQHNEAGRGGGRKLLQATVMGLKDIKQGSAEHSKGITEVHAFLFLHWNSHIKLRRASPNELLELQSQRTSRQWM